MNKVETLEYVCRLVYDTDLNQLDTTRWADLVNRRHSEKALVSLVAEKRLADLKRVGKISF